LARLLAGGHLTARERAEAGNTLAQLGDPRFPEDAWSLPDEPLLGFIEISEGPFLMGSDREHDPDAYDDELPRHEITLPTYYMARYPVTQAQYRAFVDDTGRRPPKAEGESERPYDWQEGRPPARLLNHPVVLVTWHDAVAYCDWLTQRLRTWDGIPGPLANLLRELGWVVRLPTEAEWEKATRGGDGRLYPWGDEFDAQKCNMFDTHIGSTSAVGCFLGGANSYGVEDLSGNVWEWTRSLWGKTYMSPDFKYPYDPGDGREDQEAGNDVFRVVRGGSFLSNLMDVRCAYRNGVFPDFRHRGYGFRVVLAPVPLGL
jgi:formylglycine-generating enzyme required for sulfatase activity